MNALPSLASDGITVETPVRDESRIMEEIARLLESALPPERFCAEFLDRVLTGLNAGAGAIWVRSPRGTLELQHQANRARVGLEQIPNGPACHAELLELAAQKSRTLLVPPQSGPGQTEGKIAPANLTQHALMLAPILIDQQVIGVLEAWHDSPQDFQARRGSARFLTEVAGIAAAYLHKAQWQQLLQEQRFLMQLGSVSAQLHASLDATEVAYLVVNETRRLLVCDQVSMAVRRGSEVRLEAISGVPILDPRSRLCRHMRQLAEAVLNWGECLVYQGSRDESMPLAVVQAVDAYLAEGNAKLLIALPLGGRKSEASRSAPRSLLLVECFESVSNLAELRHQLDAIVQQAGSAMHNAIEFQRLPLARFSRAWARLHDALRGRPGIKLAVAVTAAIIAVFALWLVPATLRLDAQGQLVPRERRVVYAPVNGKVSDLKVQAGDLVEKGQELLFMEDPETQLHVEQLGIQANAAEQRLATLGQRLGRTTSDDERNSLVAERVNQEYALRKAKIERDILLQERRNPRRAAVAAPIRGRVLTFDAQEQLVGKIVKQGQPLLRIARTDGAWEMELDIPENEIGVIRQQLDVAGQEGLSVQFLLASNPQHHYGGMLRRDGLGGETTIKDNAVVLPARIHVTDAELRQQLARLPVGVHIHAKIDCGRRSLGGVWFFELSEFVYEHLLF